MDEPTDDALLEAIALRRDHQAFTQLFARYQQSAYSLAMHLTRNRALAEDAMQEALLRVWTSAHAYQPDNARGWILSIVARESLRARRRKREMPTAFERESGREQPAKEAEAAQRSEQGELMSALRGVLGKLPEAEQELVGLYFGGGLSQEEIGTLLALPQQTVSFRIQKALATLRANLARAGFAASLPLLEAQTLVEAFRTGYAAPAALGESILKQIVRAAAPRGRSLRAAAAKPAGSSLWLVASAVAVAAAGLWWAAGRPRESAPVRAPELAGSAEVAASAPKPAAADWQPLPAQGWKHLVQKGGEEDAVRTQTGVVFRLVDGGDAGWSVRQGQDGAEVEQTKLGLARQNYCFQGENMSLPREWEGLIEYGQSEPGGWVAFAIRGKDSLNSSGILGKHRPVTGPARFRVVAWKAYKGFRVLSFRRDLAGRLGWVGWVIVEAEAQEAGFGVVTSTPVTFKELRTRGLPAGWTPEQDPETKRFLDFFRDKKEEGRAGLHPLKPEVEEESQAPRQEARNP